MPPTGRGSRPGSGPSDSQPPLRSSSGSSVGGGGGSSSIGSIYLGSKSTASECASSHCVTRSVCDSGYTSGFDEEYGLHYDSDGEIIGGFELDEFASIAAGLPYNGIMLLLFETPTGFALSTFSGVYCYLPDSVDNIWAEFGDPLRAALIVYPKGFLSLEDKSSAITDAGVDKQLADMINKWHHPGMNLCVGKTEYKRIIESVLKIPCMCCQTVMEIMWGIQQQMSLFVPREKSKLTKEDRLPMSQGLKKFLSNYGYDVKPEMVNQKIVMTACSLFHYDADDDKNLALLRSAGHNIRDISGIACADSDIVKLAIAVNVIFGPEEELTDFHGVLEEDVVSKLKGDAPKYKGIPVKICWLRASREAVSNHHLRSAKEKLLSSLVKKAKEAYEAEQKQRRVSCWESWSKFLKDHVTSVPSLSTSLVGWQSPKLIVFGLTLSLTLVLILGSYTLFLATGSMPMPMPEGALP